MVMQTKMAFEDMYADGSGVEYAVRYDGYADEGGGTIELEAIDNVSFPLKRVDWLIECLERIRFNAKNNE
jgi:hypothetical protein